MTASKHIKIPATEQQGGTSEHLSIMVYSKVVNKLLRLPEVTATASVHELCCLHY